MIPICRHMSIPEGAAAGPNASGPVGHLHLFANGGPPVSLCAPRWLSETGNNSSFMALPSNSHDDNKMKLGEFKTKQECVVRECPDDWIAKTSSVLLSLSLSLQSAYSHQPLPVLSKIMYSTASTVSGLTCRRTPTQECHSELELTWGWLYRLYEIFLYQKK